MPHFSNLDRPVFALTNLPETVKGALFARYSRYQGTLRRLYLDEFAADAPAGARPFDGAEGERAAQLYERIFIGYGDDSVAQLGGAHLACEWVSNVLTKVLQRGRLAAYLEQSTRYIPYDTPMAAGLEPGAPGSWRYWRDAELGPSSARDGRDLHDLLGDAEAGARLGEQRWPRGEEPQGAWERSIKAKALDLLRGLLPASTLSHVGIYASGQAYEQLLLRLASSPLPEARERRRAMALAELGAVIPSFLSRVGRPERGGEWIDYLERAPGRHRALGRPARPRPAREPGRAHGRAAPRRRRRGHCCSPPALYEATGLSRERDREPDRAPSTRSSATGCSPTSSASAATAATGRAAAGRRSATGSRSSPTTAASATCSGTGC